MPKSVLILASLAAGVTLAWTAIVNIYEARTLIRMKLYLIGKYHPGICFGMPAGSSKDPLSERLEEIRLKLLLVRMPATSTAESVQQQLHSVQLRKMRNGTYGFTVTDGQCCTVYTYEGVVRESSAGFQDTLNNREKKTLPC
jgi:hypothetical protein